MSNFGFNNQRNLERDNDTRNLLRDAFEFCVQNIVDSSSGQEVVWMPEGPTFTEPTYIEKPIHPSNDKTFLYHNLMKDTDQEIYMGYKKILKISFVVHLFYLNI